MRNESGVQGRLVLRKVGEANYLVNPCRRHGDRVWSVNQTVVEVWRLLQEGVTLAQVGDELSGRFELPEGFDAGQICAEFAAMAADSTSDNDHPTGTPVVYADAVQDGVPLHGGIELTWNCNFRCVHCYLRTEPSDEQPQMLTTAEWCGIIDQLAEAGCLYLAITGGEALLHPGFEIIYEHAALAGLLVDLYTNATLLDDRVIELLCQYPPRRVEVSMYGSSESSYERVTGARSHYAQWVRGLNLLQAAGIPVLLKAIILQENEAEVVQMRELASGRGLGLDYTTVISPRLDRVRGPEDHRLPPEEAVRIGLSITSSDASGDFLRPGSQTGWQDPAIVDCTAGRVGFWIDRTGRLQYCAMLRRPGIDLRLVPMVVAWPQLHTKTPADFGRPTECAACPSIEYCSYCPGTGRLEAEAPPGQGYACRLANARRDCHEEGGSE